MKKKFSSVKVIFFDTSDTLYKSKELEAAYPKKLIELIAEAKDISHNEAKKLFKGATDILKITENHVTKVRVAAEFGLSRSRVHEEAFCKVRPSDYLKNDKQLDLIMSRLAQKYELGIISNLKKSHMILVFDALGLSQTSFNFFVTEDIVQEIKPASEPFLKAIELAQCSAEECLYIGNSPTKDMLPAKKVGMKTILVAENPSNDDLENADDTINDIKSIEGLLN